MVTFDRGKLKSDDKPTYDTLSPLVGLANGSPEDGDPLINAITIVYGQASVTEVELDNDSFMIY